ncbi:hypothetical protein [Microvirga sesbaniae]|uniref:COG3904 family protein n=1 Tax=Microvirga sesbaniae TaxID=681392 RepID=UPI0021C8E1A1|nr:hypothetical protein [Microvirga sp. HBU67692]
MLHRLRFAAAILISCFGAFSGAAVGATIELVSWSCFAGGTCDNVQPDSILISGVIEKGDFVEFEKVLGAAPARVSSVILRSPGGNVGLAMQIGREVRAQLLNVHAPMMDHEVYANGEYAGGERARCIEQGILGLPGSPRYRNQPCICASACFLIYAAGAWRNEGYVGIHRAYLDPRTNQKLTLEQSTKAINSFREPISQYLRDMSVPSRYIDIMFGTSSREIYVPSALEIRKDFFGYPPEISEWLMARCNTVAEKEADDTFWRDMRSGKAADAILAKKERDSCIEAELGIERAARRIKLREWLAVGDPVEFFD